MVQNSLLVSALCGLAFPYATQAFVQPLAASSTREVLLHSTPTEPPNDAVVVDNNKDSDDSSSTTYYSILSESSPMGSSSDPGMASVSTTYPTLNGWYPKADFALWGLPGAIAPTGFFDPLGFCLPGTSLNDVKRMREAEVQHGRVAMVAVVGYLVGESLGTQLTGIGGPANDQLQQIPTPIVVAMGVLIGAAELYRADRGWVFPKPEIGSQTLWTLRESYYPGDLGFDPLNLKPTTDYEYQRMQTKELSHGRLAMLAWAGMCAQELVNHKTIAQTWEFYSILYSGGNPYQ